MLRKSYVSNFVRALRMTKLSLQLFSTFVNTICRKSRTDYGFKTHCLGGNLINVSTHLGAVVTVNAAVGLFSAAGKPIWLQEQQAARGSDNPLRSLVVDRRLALQADMVML